MYVARGIRAITISRTCSNGARIVIASRDWTGAHDESRRGIAPALGWLPWWLSSFGATAMTRSSPLKIASANLPAHLNERWRVIDDGELQWILQVRKGRERSKSSGWEGRSFHTSRTTLLREIARLCGAVDPNGLKTVETLPPSYRMGGRHE